MVFSANFSQLNDKLFLSLRRSVLIMERRRILLASKIAEEERNSSLKRHNSALKMYAFFDALLRCSLFVYGTERLINIHNTNLLTLNVTLNDLE